MKNKKFLSNYWQEHYLDSRTSLCGLCGNTGIIDTTQTAISPTGIKPGGKFYCICPNGRAMNPGDK